MTSDMLYKASADIESETNLYLFEQAIPANLKILESLYYIQPNSSTLLVNLVKGYAGYAFAINDTDYLRDYFLEKEKSIHREQAIYNYSKAVDYGIRYLKLNGINYKNLEAQINNEKAILEILDTNLDDDKEDLEAIMFLGQSLASLVNYNKDDLAMVSQVPLAKYFFDWVCQKDPNINFGACDIFYAAYQATRPKMLGGNIEKAKEIFLNLIKKSPDNSLARLSYIQYYLVPLMDGQGYENQRSYFQQKQDSFDKSRRWHPSTNVELQKNVQGVYDAISLKRFNIIEEFKDEIF